mgnify:CR=1 FL=1|tara:strand:+ start:1055 stop:1318 length:264 start_codon:yes stop_codon:yes gene_type:complete
MWDYDIMDEELYNVEWNKEHKWLNANPYRQDMVDSVYPLEQDIEKLKVIVETMENESLTEREYGAVLQLMEEGATFETAKKTIIDAK